MELGVLLCVVCTHPVIKIKNNIVVNIELSVAYIKNCMFNKTVCDVITYLFTPLRCVSQGSSCESGV